MCFVVCILLHSNLCMYACVCGVCVCVCGVWCVCVCVWCVCVCVWCVVCVCVCVVCVCVCVYKGNKTDFHTCHFHQFTRTVLVQNLFSMILLGEYILYHHSTKLHWKMSRVCCRLYFYECAARVTMPTATNQ